MNAHDSMGDIDSDHADPAATKRPIYITPVLFVFAIMAAMGLESVKSIWFKPYVTFWVILAAALSGLIAVSPLISGLLPQSVPTSIIKGLAHVNGYHAASFISMILIPVLYFKYKNSMSPEHHVRERSGLLPHHRNTGKTDSKLIELHGINVCQNQMTYAMKKSIHPACGFTQCV